MFFTPHLLAGGAIGAVAGNPLIAFGLGIISHHVFDLTPHTDGGTFLWEKIDPKNYYVTKPIDWAIGLTDITIGTITALVIWPHTGYNLAVLAGAVGAVLPDIIDNTPYFPHLFRRTKFGAAYHKFHSAFHYTCPPKIWYVGVITQVVIVASSIWLLLG